jgi:hypothetical protein
MSAVDLQEADGGPNAGVPEARRDAFLDMLLEHWPRIAALGWLGYERSGRGTVTVCDGSFPPELAYRPGAPCRCHADAVASYDPSAEVVLAVVRRASARPVWVQVLSGSPAPALAVCRMRVDALAETVH